MSVHKEVKIDYMRESLGPYDRVETTRRQADVSQTHTGLVQFRDGGVVLFEVRRDDLEEVLRLMENPWM